MEGKHQTSFPPHLHFPCLPSDAAGASPRLSVPCVCLWTRECPLGVRGTQKRQPGQRGQCVQRCQPRLGSCLRRRLSHPPGHLLWSWVKGFPLGRTHGAVWLWLPPTCASLHKLLLGTHAGVTRTWVAFMLPDIPNLIEWHQLIPSTNWKPGAVSEYSFLPLSGLTVGFPGSSVVKNLSAIQET